jgi:hypothetical protein
MINSIVVFFDFGLDESKLYLDPATVKRIVESD